VWLWLNQGIIMALVWWDIKQPQKSSARIADNPAKIKTVKSPRQKYRALLPHKPTWYFHCQLETITTSVYKHN